MRPLQPKFICVVSKLFKTVSRKVLLDQLELMCLSTRNLVLRCCADLAEQQAKAVGSPEHKLGELTLSVGYIKEAGNIEVTIFQGQSLPQRNTSVFYIIWSKVC